MRAVVLVGGAGTRLRPLTYDLPKPMLPIVGRPMIVHTIEWLARHGIEEVIFSLGYRPDAFMSAFPEGSWRGVQLTYAVEPEPLDTAGAIRFAAEAADASNERLVVVNGDVLTDLDLSELIEFHDRSGGEGTIHLTAVSDPSAFGVVPTDADGRVEAFVEKPPPGTAPTNFINAGTYVLEPAAIARIPKHGRVSIERVIFPQMVEDGVLFAMGNDAYWIDTGTPANFLTAQYDALSGRRIAIELPPHHESEPGVFAGEHAIVDGNAVAPVLLGIGARIEHGARVERSVIGDGVIVEVGAEVVGSVVLAGSAVRAGARVTDSIVGEACEIGPAAEVTGLSIIGFGVMVEGGSSLDSARVPV